MKSLLNKTLATLLLVTLLGTLLTSCTKNLPKETIVYQNSFDNGKGDMQVFKPNGLDANSFGLNFEGRNILGPFNHRTAYINLPQLPPHVLLNLSFDLYIHDQWAGYGINPPDYWGLYIDKQRVFYTTFSNIANAAQSFPEHEGFKFPPASNAIEKLQGLNSLSTRSDGTAMYHFVWTVAHTNSSIEIALSDLVADTNVLNKSWSIDNLKVITTQIIK